MRILLNTKPLVLSDKSGIGYYVSNLHRELRASGIDVHPTLDAKSQRVLNTLRKISFSMRRSLGKWDFPFLCQLGDTLIRNLSGGGPKGLHYDLYHETSLDLMPDIKMRSLCNLYDLAFIRHPELLPPRLASFWRANVERNVKVAKRVIVNTKFIRDEAVDLLKLNEEAMDIIPLAPSRFFQPTGPRIPHRKQATRFTEKDYILYVGTVEPRKGLKTLIRAYREIKDRYDLSLVIAGGLGWLYEDILSYPAELGMKREVIFTKYVDEGSLLDLYRHASVFVYPSVYEGFGLPPLEAMACGTPVLVSDIPPLTEVTGGAALSFNPKDHEALADVLGNVLSSESLRMELKDKGYQQSAGYSWDKVVTATIQTYQKILKD